MRTRPLRSVGVTALVVAAASAVASLAAAGPASGAPPAAAWRSAFEARPPVATGGRAIVVLAAPSLADRVAARGTPLPAAAERRAVAAAERAQRLLVATLRAQGIRIRRERVYTRTLNGFSALLDGRARAALERAPGVIGVYPVRTVYPASLSAASLSGVSEEGSAGIDELRLPGVDGTGVTVAVLDTGIDRMHPALRGRVLRGLDLVAGDTDAAPARSPADPSIVEAHGTRVAGIVAASDPGGLRGVAPGATILPIRVLGWRRTESGAYQVAGSSDVLLAGLERAVDPNGDGATTDAARIALAALVEPYAGFADGPEARAAAGALRLGTLLVAAAGNDGAGSGGFGTIGAPAGAPDALAVGAADLRARVPLAEVGVTVDGEEIHAGLARVLGQVVPEAAVQLTGGDVVAIPANGTPVAPRARALVAAGAKAVAVYGSGLPAGALDLDERLAVPVMTLPLAAGRALARAIEAGTPASVTIGPARWEPNPDRGRVAGFSSRGPALDGGPKPELVAPGVGVPTTDGGGGSDPRYATVTGSSAAAAATAGAASLVAAARPSLSAAELAAALVGSASRLGAQGAGLVDPARAAAQELALTPAALSFGLVTGPGWSAERTVAVTNLSGRRLEVSLSAGQERDSTVALSVEPARLVLQPGKTRSVRIRARAAILPEAADLAGTIVAEAAGGTAAGLPWSAASFAGGVSVIQVESLSPGSFRPSEAPAAVLSFAVGRAASGRAGVAITPVAVLDVELWRGSRRLGLLARLRELLPGRYELGLTGRGPTGGPLPPGRYTVRLRARTVARQEGGAGVEAWASVPLTIHP